MKFTDLPLEIREEMKARGLVVGATIQHTTSIKHGDKPWMIIDHFQRIKDDISSPNAHNSWAWIFRKGVWAQNQDDVIRKGDIVERIAGGSPPGFTIGERGVVTHIADDSCYVNGVKNFRHNVRKIKLSEPAAMGFKKWDLLEFKITGAIRGDLQGTRCIAFEDEHSNRTVAVLNQDGGKYDCDVAHLKKVGTVPDPAVIMHRTGYGKPCTTDQILQCFLRGLVPGVKAAFRNQATITIGNSWWFDNKCIAATGNPLSLWLHYDGDWSVPLTSNTDAGRSPSNPNPNTSDEQEREAPPTVRRRGQAIDPGPGGGCEVATGVRHHGNDPSDAYHHT